MSKKIIPHLSEQTSDENGGFAVFDNNQVYLWETSEFSQDEHIILLYSIDLTEGFSKRISDFDIESIAELSGETKEEIVSFFNSSDISVLSKLIKKLAFFTSNIFVFQNEEVVDSKEIKKRFGKFFKFLKKSDEAKDESSKEDIHLIDFLMSEPEIQITEEFETKKIKTELNETFDINKAKKIFDEFHLGKVFKLTKDVESMSPTKIIIPKDTYVVAKTMPISKTKPNLTHNLTKNDNFPYFFYATPKGYIVTLSLEFSSVVPVKN